MAYAFGENWYGVLEGAILRTCSLLLLMMLGDDDEDDEECTQVVDEGGQI